MRVIGMAVWMMVLSGCGTGAEICGNGVDDDLDGLVDCEEPLCQCSADELCSGGFDEDDDGLIDCADDDCASEEACIESLCDDGLDNDGDGPIDCLDSDCDSDCPEVCDDGRDNDGDGLIDCEDADCVDAEACGELLCDDGLDDDGDGLIDCDDDDCWGLDCHPDGIRTQVTGGMLTLRDRARRTTVRTSGSFTSYASGTTVDLECGPGESSVIRMNSSELQLADIAGVARVRVGSATETCAWGFNALTVDGADGVFTPGERPGFTISNPERCLLAGTSWLPPTLTRNGARLDAEGVRRYAVGNPTMRTETTSGNNTTTFMEGCYRAFSTYTRTEITSGDGAFGDELTIFP